MVSVYSYQANENEIIKAFDAMTGGRVLASSPAVFEEMVANGELQLIRNTKLLQALYEFSNVSFHAWNTLRHHYINATGSITGILIYKTTKEKSVQGYLTNLIVPDRLKLQRFLTQPNLLGALNSSMVAQENQLSLVIRQLQLARSIQDQIELQGKHQLRVASNYIA